MLPVCISCHASCASELCLPMGVSVFFYEWGVGGGAMPGRDSGRCSIGFAHGDKWLKANRGFLLLAQLFQRLPVLCARERLDLS
jgi:hypothetical protein